MGFGLCVCVRESLGRPHVVVHEKLKTSGWRSERQNGTGRAQNVRSAQLKGARRRLGLTRTDPSRLKARPQFPLWAMNLSKLGWFRCWISPRHWLLGLQLCSSVQAMANAARCAEGSCEWSLRNTYTNLTRANNRELRQRTHGLIHGRHYLSWSICGLRDVILQCHDSCRTVRDGSPVAGTT